MKVNKTFKTSKQNFKARRIAVANPIINGITKKVEVYSIDKNERKFIKKITDSINMEELLPSQKEKSNFSVWKGIIDAAAESLGTMKKQNAYIAIYERKPCGIIVTNDNRKKGIVGLFATWPIAIEQKVKKAGSILFTTFLDKAQKKKWEKISLEPVINGPTDSVGFYIAHGMTFPDQKASVMTAQKRIIKDTFEAKKHELNYQNIKRPEKVKLENIVDIH